MRTLIYLVIFFYVCLALVIVPKVGGFIWDPLIIVPATAALFTLLVWLVARFLGTDRTAMGVVMTAVFILIFAPGAGVFFERDEEALLELSSQCIVPFFLTQYKRISRKDFRRAYGFMLLMGIFCSFTHDGITLPLCLAFLLLAWQLSLLWDAKIFVFALVLTFWLSTTSWGRTELWRTFRRQRLIAYSLLFALSCVPFAPLGIDNAVTGVCFFGLLWALLLCQRLMQRYADVARVRTS